MNAGQQVMELHLHTQCRRLATLRYTEMIIKISFQAASNAPSAKRPRSSSEDVDVEAEARKGNVCIYSLLPIIISLPMFNFPVEEGYCACAQGLFERSWFKCWGKETRPYRCSE